MERGSVVGLAVLSRYVLNYELISYALLKYTLPQTSYQPSALAKHLKVHHGAEVVPYKAGKVSYEDFQKVNGKLLIHFLLVT